MEIKAIYPVMGMSCTACASSVESMIKTAPGVNSASVNYAGQELQVDFDPEVTNPQAFQQILQSIGYDIIVDPAHERELVEEYQHKKYHYLLKNTVGSLVFSLPVFVMAMFFHHRFHGENWVMMVLTAPVLTLFGRQFFVTGFKQIRHFRSNMDTLVALSTGIAFLFSVFNTVFPGFFESRGMEAQVYYESAAVIITFILLGKLLEERAKARTSSSLKSLMGMQPATVKLLLADGTEEEVSLARIRPGDKVRVHPGDRIPVDGSVTGGHTFVDESMITGEPVAVEKTAGAEVFAGTVNTSGSIEMTAAKIGSETLLGQIIRRVHNAQASKAPVQKMADRVASVFVPTVLAISLLTFLLWLILGGMSQLSHAMLSLISVLIVACPCALGLATPTAVMVGIGRGARRGILVRDAESLEVACKVDTVVLDKTGTITEGHPEVIEVKWFRPDQTEDYIDILKTVESRSKHPLANAIVGHFGGVTTGMPETESFEYKSGMGIVARVKGKQYLVGNSQLLEEYKVPDQRVDIFDQAGMTVVRFADESGLILALALTDRIRETSAGAIRDLQRSGIEVIMLTGDQKEAALRVAAAVGIEQVHAHQTPGIKGMFIKQLQSEGHVVAMVGDGINDAQALAQADVSIAMGHGSDVAMEVARMTLIHSDLNLVAAAMALSKKTVTRIRQNLFWAFIYNIFAIPLAAGALYSFTGFLLSPMIAGAAMAMSSVSVVSNSLRK